MPVGRVQEIARRITGAAAVVHQPGPLPIVSPWADSRLSSLVYADVFGDTIPQPVSRAMAMRVPAIARGRNLMVATISRFPMYDYEGDTQTPAQPSWLAATDVSHPSFRLAYTVDDLIFYGYSVWSRDVGPDGTPRYNRMDRSTYTVDANWRVTLTATGQFARADEVIIIPGLHEGILSFGRDVISDTTDLYKVVRQRLKSPVPPIDLHMETDAEMTDEEIDALINRWVKARNNPNGAVGFSNKAIKVNVLQTGDDAQLMVEARNAASLDGARIIGVSANRVDATSAKASLNYETSTGKNLEFVDFDLALYMTPITARLSMDDVSAPGHRVGFDLEDFTALTPSPSGPGVPD